jgi:hypothetical protein
MKTPRRRLVDETRLRPIAHNAAYPNKQDIPHWIARGMVRGLLMFFSMPRRGPRVDRISLQVIEDALLSATEHWRSGLVDESQYTNEQVRRMASAVPDIIESLLLHPSEDVISEESNRLISLFKGYTSLRGQAARLRWLKRALPEILPQLLRWSRCPLQPPDCPRRTDMPADKELKQWAEKNGSRHVIFHLLAHHHGSTHSAVKDHFHRHRPRRSPGSRPPQHA